MANPIAQEIQDLLVYIETSYSPAPVGLKPKLILNKLQGYLKRIKSRKASDFYQLYTYKTEFSKKNSSNLTDLKEELQQYWKKLKQATHLYKDLSLNNDFDPGRVHELLCKAIEIFEQKVMAEIFSIELFWREMIYLNSMAP